MKLQQSVFNHRLEPCLGTVSGWSSHEKVLVCFSDLHLHFQIYSIEILVLIMLYYDVIYRMRSLIVVDVLCLEHVTQAEIKQLI